MKFFTKHFYAFLGFAMGLGIFMIAKSIDSRDSEASTWRPEPVTPIVEKQKEKPVTSSVTRKTTPEPKPKSVSEPEPPPPKVEQGLTCADFDPVNNPKDVQRIFVFASAKTDVPAGLLYGTWMKETGGEVYGDKRHAGGCHVMTQMRIRESNGKRGDKQIAALREMEKHYPWKADDLQGSCGTDTFGVNTGNAGGCIGPMQITPTEWMQEEGWETYDPLKLCDSVVMTGFRLKRHHDQHIKNVNDPTWTTRFSAKWNRRNAYMKSQTPWENATRRYIGGAWRPASYGYYSRVVNGTKSWKFKSGWKYWDTMYASDDFTWLEKLAEERAKIWKGRIASN